MAPLSTTTKGDSEQIIDERKQRSILAGRILANPLPGEEVVISGTTFIFIKMKF